VYGSVDTDCYGGRDSRIWIVIRSTCLDFRCEATVIESKDLP
jgi:hypothetical protein